MITMQKTKYVEWLLISIEEKTFVLQYINYVDQKTNIESLCAVFLSYSILA